MLKRGGSLGKIAEHISGTSGIKRRQGLIGFLSNKRWKREELNRIAVEMAIVSSFWESVEI